MKNFNRFAAVAATVAMVGVSFLQAGVVKADTTPVISASDAADTFKTGVVSNHVLTIALPATLVDGANVVVTYPAGITLTDPGALVASCHVGTAPTVALLNNVMTISANGDCTGPVTIGATLSAADIAANKDFRFTNPAVGPYLVQITGTGLFVGTFGDVSVTNDQVFVTATVEPSISFAVGAEAATTPCVGGFSTDGGTVHLGIIPLDKVASSDVNSVEHICSNLSTNANGGAVVTVSSLHAALQSDAVAGDRIESNGGTIQHGTANYGLCLDDIKGMDDSMPVSSPVVADFAHACVSGVDADPAAITALTTAAQHIWHVDHVTANAFQSIEVKAAISGTTAAHSDYKDTLTFVATGTF